MRQSRSVPPRRRLCITGRVGACHTRGDETHSYFREVAPTISCYVSRFPYSERRCWGAQAGAQPRKEQAARNKEKPLRYGASKALELFGRFWALIFVTPL
ncbi:hypothetical protein M408DRAFT_332094 [Serendipita vermifera MAFF 305830]|uniref:Uncharacterized protein n=1 Tax=Serendipita vermifera MAFF 305830 TaxID=933852 RepID=A0A0C2X3A5_SERVB|nr:hypothetical protein M408DRAFT_332094 [Serendipita vermifera MAFF 305830]